MVVPVNLECGKISKVIKFILLPPRAAVFQMTARQTRSITNDVCLSSTHSDVCRRTDELTEQPNSLKWRMTMDRRFCKKVSHSSVRQESIYSKYILLAFSALHHGHGEAADIAISTLYARPRRRNRRPPDSIINNSARLLSFS